MERHDSGNYSLTHAAARGRLRWWIAAAAVAIWLAVHFALVLLYVLPPNPISVALPPIARAYLLPRFAQDWRLFAPTPVANDYAVFARATYLDGADEHTTEWLDLSSPVFEEVRRNRLSQHKAIWTLLLSSMYDLGNRVGPRDGPARRRLLEEWGDLARQPQSLVVLEGSASAALAAAHPGRELRTVQVMLAIQQPLGFSERLEPESVRPPAEYVTFRPVPFQHVAAWSPPE